MLRFGLFTILLMFLSPAGAEDPPRPDPNRWIGMRAPDFRLTGSDGKAYNLKTMTEQGSVVVLWFPKAYTGNVDRLLESVDTIAPELAKRGISIVAVSCDKPKYLTPYARELGLTIPLLADPTRTTAIQWGAVGSGREIPHRWAYFVNRESRIAAIRADLDADSAGSKIREKAFELGWLE